MRIHRFRFSVKRLGENAHYRIHYAKRRIEAPPDTSNPNVDAPQNIDDTSKRTASQITGRTYRGLYTNIRKRMDGKPADTTSPSGLTSSAQERITDHTRQPARNPYHQKNATRPLPKGRPLARMPPRPRTATPSMNSSPAVLPKKNVAETVTVRSKKRAIDHVKRLSQAASRRTQKALKWAGKSAIKACAAAAKSLASMIAAGGIMAVVAVLLLCMFGSLLASPFGIFSHTDHTEFQSTTTLSNAIVTPNNEYYAEIERLRGTETSVHLNIEGNIEEDIEPQNWVDVLAVFSVNTTMRDFNALDVVQLDDAKMYELRKVFWAMNPLYSSREPDDPTLYIKGKCRSYRDMITEYSFTGEQKELVEELMSDKYYEMWANYVNASLGYQPDDWGGVETIDDGDEPTIGSGGMPIPQLFQGDYDKTVCVIDGKAKSAASSGCGAASMSMVVRYLTGSTSATPYTEFKWAYDNGYYDGSGLGHDAVSAIGRRYGVTGTWVGRNGDKIISALKSGKPVIAHMGPGIFTKRGHYIVLRGVTNDGKILVNDPASRSRTGKAYPLSTILNQGKGDTPFMICRKK